MSSPEAVRRWVFRRGCTASHIDHRFGLYVGYEDYHTAMAEYYGWPWYRCGVYLCFGRNTWFVGFQYEKVKDEEHHDQTA